MDTTALSFARSTEYYRWLLMSDKNSKRKDVILGSKEMHVASVLLGAVT